MLHLVVGLGNPGPRHARNRHNVGFMVVGAIAEAAGVSFREKFSGRFTRANLEGGDVVLLTPLTFMNRSGESVAEAAQFFQVPLERVLVVHDELDLPFGQLKLKSGGGLAGHNGLRSIAERTGTRDFGRLRVGIGRPEAGSILDWVLGDFEAADIEAGAALPAVLSEATRAVSRVLMDGLPAAMNTVNARTKARSGEFDEP